jgi:hypothetical protein
MDLVKKNWISIAFGVIALLAVIADFWPMGGKYEQLRSEAQARSTVNSELQQLENKPRTKPITSVSSSPTETAEPLGVFPTQKVIDAGKTATDKLAEGSKLLAAEVVKLNMHQPLVPGALPGQADNKTPLINFARAYNEALPPLQDMANPDRRKNCIGVTVLHGDVPPSETELTKAKEDKKAAITNEQKLIDAGGNITNQQAIDLEINTALAALADDLRRSIANKCMVYFSQDTFSVFNNPPILVGLPPDPSTIFWAQIGLWTQQDFCSAVYAINTLPGPDGKKPENVLDAPIKHVVKIILPQTAQTIPFIGVSTAANDPNAPPPAPADPNAPITKNTALSPTGRVSNPMYDVVQFDVELIVDAERLPMVLEELGRGRFMTVVQVVSVTAVDSSIYHSLGYYYGAKPVVNVKLKIEDLFLREWTTPMMPMSVRQRLGIAPPANPA